MAESDTGEAAAPERRVQGVRKTLGENIKTTRGLRGLTVRELSSDLKRLGLSLSPTGVSEVENASRKVAADELLVIAIALNTSPVDLLLPPERVWLEVSDRIEPMIGSPLLHWLQGRRPWSQTVSRDDFVDAAREPNRNALRWQDFPVLRAIDALESPVRLALTDLPHLQNVPLGPLLQKALDRVVKEVGNLIAATEVEDIAGDGR